MARPEPLYPHIPKSRKTETASHLNSEDLRVKLVEKMAEEMGARDEYYELAKTAHMAGLPNIAIDLRGIGDVEHSHFRKLSEMERSLR